MVSTNISHDPVDWIRRLPRYTELGEREQNVLAAICDVVQYSAGEMILEQDTRPPVIPLLVQGEVAVNYRLESGAHVELTSMESPELIGFLWFLDSEVRCPLDFLAKKASVCLNIRTLDLENLYVSGNALSYPILAYLYTRSAEQFRMFNDVFRKLYEDPKDTYLRLVEQTSPT